MGKRSSKLTTPNKRTNKSTHGVYKGARRLNMAEGKQKPFHHLL